MRILGLRDFNKALLTKWLRRFISREESAWAKVEIKRYFKHRVTSASEGRQSGRMLALWKVVHRMAAPFRACVASYSIGCGEELRYGRMIRRMGVGS